MEGWMGRGFLTQGRKEAKSQRKTLRVRGWLSGVAGSAPRKPLQQVQSACGVLVEGLGERAAKRAAPPQCNWGVIH
jgi:hypothetical protein